MKKLISAITLLPLLALADDLPKHTVVGKALGMMDKETFLKFIDGTTGAAAQPSMFDGRSTIAVLVLTFLGGLALNLTPCVLPMIPVNLSIIGASQKEHRWSGILRASVYSLGMVIACGVTGVIAVFGGASLGGLASTWYFNLLAGIVFLLLGCSLFDMFNLDLSKYQMKFKTPSSAKFIGVFLLGVMTAILAGACVAPVVIAIMIYSAGLYASGFWWGLVLPFLLGLGMAFPWPLLAAGISFLPKPGGWMVHVKHLFGFLIILMGIYYGIQSWKILFPETEDNPATLQEVLVLSKESGKPVFVDFYADWCKNCIAMEKTVFQDPDVKAKLEEYEFIKIDATNTHDPRIRKLLDQYDIKGLPAYLILKAE